MPTKSAFLQQKLKTPTMVVRGPLVVDPTTDGHQAKAAHLPSKTVVKETQREVSGLESPNQSTNKGQTLNRAQDVAELKDYVGHRCAENQAF